VISFCNGLYAIRDAVSTHAPKWEYKQTGRIIRGFAESFPVEATFTYWLSTLWKLSGCLPDLRSEILLQIEAGNAEFYAHSTFSGLWPPLWSEHYQILEWAIRFRSIQRWRKAICTGVGESWKTALCSMSHAEWWPPRLVSA